MGSSFSRFVILFFSIACTTSSSAQENSTYTIGVGDLLDIEIRNLGVSEYSFSSRVPPSGAISIPLLDEIGVKDRSILETEALIESALRAGYLNKPEVTITISEFRPFFIKGAVQDPGAFPYQNNITVEKAIALADGLTETADVSKITIKRSGSDSQQNAEFDDPIFPGDVIHVEGTIEKHRNKFVYLYGEVKSPGSYPFRDDLTIEKAVVLAGGFTERASKRKITIRRGEVEPFEVIKKPKLYLQVKPGDVITIGQSFF